MQAFGRYGNLKFPLIYNGKSENWDLSRCIKNKHLKVGVMKNKNIYGALHL